MNTREQDIIDQGLFHLQNELGKPIKWKKPPQQNQTTKYDAVFTLNKVKVFVEAKNEVRPYQINQFLAQKEKVGHILIAANYITPNAKKILRENKLNYIDRVGNAWINIETIYIHIDGRYNQPPAAERKKQAFTRSGIKIIFQFLLNPGLVNATYREIVAVCDVALGTVPKVINGLKETGILIKKTREVWIINDSNELINTWQNEYTKKLKPTLFINRYRPIDPQFYLNWKKMKLDQGTLWGGEPAGDLLTNYLKPQLFTLYTNKTKPELMKFYKWVPDPDGNVLVYRKFWANEIEATVKNCVPPILAYADLMELDETRCLETANLIYEQYLQKP